LPPLALTSSATNPQLSAWQREKRPTANTPMQASATPEVSNPPESQAPPLPPKDLRYERAPALPSLHKAALSSVQDVPVPKLNKTQRAQHQKVPGSAASTEAKSYASAATASDQPNGEGWIEAKSKGKRPQPPAKKGTPITPKATLYTKYTIHFTVGKPKQASITPSRCIKVWRRIHPALSENPVARPSGAATIKGVNMSRGGNLAGKREGVCSASHVSRH
jgi:hypothetical protein